MQRSTFRLSFRHRAAVYFSFGVLFLSGAAWMLVQSRLEDTVWETLPRILMKVHGGAAMLALLVLGALVNHVRRGWQADRNRLSGAVVLGLNAFLVLTGYGLYYAGDEAVRAWLSRWHGWIGLSMVLLLPAHVVAGRLITRNSSRAGPSGPIPLLGRNP